jgi:cell division protein FtsX
MLALGMWYDFLMKRTLALLAAVLGIVFLGLAWLYWSTPANLLPSFMPGFDASAATVHFKHGLGALIVALALFIFAWFESGKKK